VNEFASMKGTGGEEHQPARETRADTSPEPTAAGFRATWARAENRGRIGKVQTLSGKWKLSSGATSSRFFFEAKTYRGLEEFRIDYKARMKNGRFALIAGDPRPDRYQKNPYRRVKQNFIDAASTKLTIDFDGLEPDNTAAPIDSAGAYSESVIPIMLGRLPKMFGPAKCMVSTTSSTGLTTVSTGEPSGGKARLRGTWELSRPLTCGQKKMLAKALKALPGLGCIDDNIYSLEHFEFVARPEFLPGETDPISEPVYMLGGGLLDIDAISAELGIDLDDGPEGVSYTGVPLPGSGSPVTPKAGLALDLHPEQAEPLLRALMAAIGNDIGLRDDYDKWFGVVAALYNASKGAEWGRELAVEWTASGGYDTAEVDKKWKALTKSGDGRNGVDYLIKLAVALAKEKKAEAATGDDAARVKVEELEAAVSGIDRARAAATGFPDDGDTLAAQKTQKAQKPAQDRLREALCWSGMDAALAGGSNIARNQFGFAMIGKGASGAAPVARQWITDRHVRGRVSMLSAMPEGGKTILSVGYSHAIATERPSLMGLSEIDRHGAVAIIALDNERADEFDLKGRAFRKHHSLLPGDFKHEIYVIEDCGPLVERQPDGDLGPSRGIIALAPQLAWLREHEKLSLIVIDTMLGAAGSGDTSDGPAMSVIMQIARTIAEALNCAVDLINHLTKGGAARNPDSMDAALGARSASATPRFMTNLKKEGVYVRTTQAKRSYIGPRGCSLYEFKSVNIASTRPEDPARTVTENVGVLVPAARTAMAEAFAVEDAHQALWEAHDKRKVKIRLCARKGSKGRDHTSAIIEEAGIVDNVPAGERRARAKHLTDVLIKDSRVEVVKEWPNGNPVKFVVPKEPEERV
jgi:AAA domain/Primase C terminal 2 (PriCT-2)